VDGLIHAVEIETANASSAAQSAFVIPSLGSSGASLQAALIKRKALINHRYAADISMTVYPVLSV
jgi:hypothetical protein